MKDRVKIVRTANNLSMKSFGERIGLGASSVQRIESGIYSASEQTIRAICASFNISRRWLETGEGEMHEPSPTDLISQLAAEHNLGPGGQALLRVVLRIFDELGPDNLDHIIKDTIPAILAEHALDPAALAAQRAEPPGSEDQAN